MQTPAARNKVRLFTALENMVLGAIFSLEVLDCEVVFNGSLVFYLRRNSSFANDRVNNVPRAISFVFHFFQN